MILVTAIALGIADSRAAESPWPAITAQTKPWVWWWWHGSAVDETNLARELREFRDAGLGGAQVTPIFGVKGAEARDIPYLTPHWLDMMGYTVDEAKRLGLGLDMTLGTGWCFGGPSVSDQDANADPVVRTFAVNAGEKLREKFTNQTTQALMAYSSGAQPVDLRDKISGDGSVDWIAPAGNWTVYAVSQRPSGQKVKRAAPGGEGWMLNPLYPEAVTNWLKWFDGALANYRGSLPQAVFQDSYEYRATWSPGLFAEFEKRRGYRLQDELPALFVDNFRQGRRGGPVTVLLPDPDHAARVKYDYRLTASEIMVEESEPAWIDWAHRHGTGAIYQAHGTPGNWLDLYGDADVPETEMFHNDRSILISKFASSAAHTQGRQLVGAETGTWVKEHFTETLADLKQLADEMFLSGVNRIFYHGNCYSPADAPWPGWLFYASTEMNSRNPIWHDVPTLNAYVARCQSILQAGAPDNDVLVYWPVADFWSQPNGMLQSMTVSSTDWFEKQPIGATAHQLWEHGYSFDYVSDAQLLKAKVTGNKVRMPGGKYSVILVPECRHMPLETLKQLLALAKNDASVIFVEHPPQDVPGAGDLERRHAEFQGIGTELSRLMAGKSSVAVTATGDLISALSKCGVDADLGQGSALPFVRRATERGWDYFVANRGTNAFDDWVTLARPVKSAVICEPMTGQFGSAAARKASTAGDGLQVHLQLAPGESTIIRAFAEKGIAAAAWPYRQNAGKTTEVKGNWKVSFVAGGPVLPETISTNRLASWTTFPDTNCQAFAGTAKYETVFTVPGTTGQTFELDLGDVRQSARVRLNGKDYGTLIAPPFRVVVDKLKPGGNVLEVEVTSVAANRIRDLDRRGVEWKIFKDTNFVDENYRPFNAANWPLTDCGLLGPVTLTPVRVSDSTH